MELLIPGLILVALMAWASTKIKKRAADAFESEAIETDIYSIRKPEGFLHVLGDTTHEFYAYSKEFGEGASSKIRRATIEIDILKTSLQEARTAVKKSATKVDVRDSTTSTFELETDEIANEVAVRGFYKIVATPSGVFQLRVAVLSEYAEEFLSKVKETLDSFFIRPK
jgi:hypothetical protein